MKWAIEIQKTSLENRNLSDLLGVLGFKLIEEEEIDYLALTSPEIEMSLTPDEVFKKAKAVRAAFKGTTDPEFELGSVIDYSTNPPRRHTFLEIEPLVITLTMGTITATISPPAGLSANELTQWETEHEERQYQAKLERQLSKLEPAYFNKNAAKVIELLSVDEPRAEILYKVYELAEGPVKNRAHFHRQFGITQDQFDRFRDAIHNPSVHDKWARHANPSTPRTLNPMTKEEAVAFIREIATQWLQSLRSRSKTNGT